MAEGVHDGAGRYRYPTEALIGDYARSGTGLALSGGPFLFVTPHWVVGVVLGAMALLFAGFGLRTALRQRQAIDIDETGVILYGLVKRTRIEWEALARVTLAYYSTKRDRTDGWMDLTLVDGTGGRIQIESSLDGFHAIAETAAELIEARATAGEPLMVSETTLVNFQALGITLKLPKLEEE